MTSIFLVRCVFIFCDEKQRKKTKACDKMARSDMSNDLGKGTQQIYFGKLFATKVINKSTKKCLFRTSWLFSEKSVILQFSRKSQEMKLQLVVVAAAR